MPVRGARTNYYKKKLLLHFCPAWPDLLSLLDWTLISMQYEGGAKEGGRRPSIWDTFTHQHPGTRAFCLSVFLWEAHTLIHTHTRALISTPLSNEQCNLISWWHRISGVCRKNRWRKQRGCSSGPSLQGASQPLIFMSMHILQYQN